MTDPSKDKRAGWDLESRSSDNSSFSSNSPKSLELPSQKGTSAYRTLRWRALTPYRRLFAVVLIGNLIPLILVCLRWKTPPSRQAAIRTAVTANSLVSIMFRNEHIVNALYRLVLFCAPKGTPLWWRRLCSKVYVFGGLHSGAGISASVWMLALTIDMVQKSTRFGGSSEQVPAVVLSISIWMLLVVMMVVAMPQIRHRMHNTFERVHRLSGWTIIALFWALLMVSEIGSVRDESLSLSAKLVKSANFWMLLLITLFVVYPWLQLRRVPIQVERLSSHAVRVWFDSKHTHASSALGCRTIRIATRPLFETHSFAVVPEQDASNYSIIVSRAGDFTKSMIETPPAKVWIKGMPTWGVLRVATLFDPVIVIATGSGIGPCLGLFNDHERLPCRVLWSARAPQETYGDNVMNAVRRADPNAVIVDTNVSGHPDMLQWAYSLYKKSGAEAVLVISNPKLTYELCQGLESRGIPAFGPIWDS